MLPRPCKQCASPGTATAMVFGIVPMGRMRSRADTIDAIQTKFNVAMAVRASNQNKPAMASTIVVIIAMKSTVVSLSKSISNVFKYLNISI